MTVPWSGSPPLPPRSEQSRRPRPLGLPLTAVVGVVTLVVLSRLHRSRSAAVETAEPVAEDDLPG